MQVYLHPPLRDSELSSCVLAMKMNYPNALLVFTSGLKFVDYHKKMLSDNHEKWLKTNLIPNTPPDSVLTIYNATYHNIHVPHSNFCILKKI
jgi:hypothetical protein